MAFRSRDLTEQHEDATHATNDKSATGLHMHDSGVDAEDKQTPATRECRESLLIFTEMMRDIKEGRGEKIVPNKDCVSFRLEEDSYSHLELTSQTRR